MKKIPTSQLIRVRQAESRDVPDITRMVGLLAEFHGDQSALTATTLIRDLSGADPWLQILVAERSDSLIGYAALCRTSQLQFGRRGMDVHHLFVDADQRGRGVGNLLLDACVTSARAQSCHYLTVGTHVENLKAQALYAGFGFKRQQADRARFALMLEAS